MSTPYFFVSDLTVPITISEFFEELGNSGVNFSTSIPNGVTKTASCSKVSAAFRFIQKLVEPIAVDDFRFPRNNALCSLDLLGNSYTSLPQTDNSRGL
ncbi:hypothetical protein D9M72_580060 [compost metagenome]